MLKSVPRVWPCYIHPISVHDSQQKKILRKRKKEGMLTPCWIQEDTYCLIEKL